MSPLRVQILAMSITCGLVVPARSKASANLSFWVIPFDSKVASATGGCRALLGSDGRGARPHTSLSPHDLSASTLRFLRSTHAPSPLPQPYAPPPRLQS